MTLPATKNIPLLDKAALLAPAIRMLARKEGKSLACFFYNETIAGIIHSKEVFLAGLSQSIDKQVFFVESSDDIEADYTAIENGTRDYRKVNNTTPTIIAVQHTGIFCIAETKHAATMMLDAFLNKTVPHNQDNNRKPKRLSGKIIVVTGSAQGFGKGIAEMCAKDGAHVVIADINENSAIVCAKEIETLYGAGCALAIRVDVTNEDSIKNMMQETVLSFGGIDVFISNAGILKAGSLEEMDLPSFDLVTKINYTAFFLCTKYASRYMKIQHRFNTDYYSDIIQINSKSGLEGSNKNFAYAGSKFGGIGLTQSYALELVDYNIKVNAICPGNFFEGPLWSDPKTGLFAQYLKANKVPGAKTLDDVKRFYNNKVPMKRGCLVDDVYKAAIYLIDQKYETGQALPVTGGQVMLN